MNKRQARGLAHRIAYEALERTNHLDQEWWSDDLSDADQERVKAEFDTLCQQHYNRAFVPSSLKDETDAS